MPPLPDAPWTTNTPASQDTGTNGQDQMPDLTPDTSPGAEDGHRILVSHILKLRDKLQSLYLRVGTDDLLPAGSLRELISNPENVPRFERDSGSTSQINALSPPGGGSTLRVVLGDGNAYAAAAPLQCDIDTTGIGGRDASESVAIGIWHLFGVDDAGSLGLVLSRALPAVGPPNHNSGGKFKYLWSVRVASIGGTVIEKFAHAGAWYYQTEWLPHYQLVNYNTAAAVAWTSLLAELQAAMPTAVADQVQLSGFVDADSPNHEYRVYVHPGPSGPTENEYFRFLAVQTSATGQSQETNTRILPLLSEAISWRFSWVSGSPNVRIGLLGYRNALYPGRR